MGVFANLGWDRLFLLLTAALVILGPERLPAAMASVSRTLRQIRDYTSSGLQNVKDELCPEFEELRHPLAELSPAARSLTAGTDRRTPPRRR